MNSPPSELRDDLSLYLDEEEGETALRRAADWTRAHVAEIDMTELLEWVQFYASATQDRRARAQVVLRAALGLRLVPGPVCRPAS